VRSAARGDGVQLGTGSPHAARPSPAARGAPVRDRPLRLLLIGAFAYPHEQGSQVYFQEQAIALRAAGADVHLLTYGPGREPPPRDPDRWRALDGFEHDTLPAWATPASRRSGPRIGKPFADLGLAFALRRRLSGGSRRARPAWSSSASSAQEIASGTASNDASTTPSINASKRWDPIPGTAVGTERPGRPEAFDAILAHHAEAALIALHGSGGAHPPVVYCAHTLLGLELPEYFKCLPEKDFSNDQAADRRGGGALDRARRAPGVGHRIGSAIGRAIDRRLARSAAAWIALTQETERVMRASGRAPGQRIAPPIPAARPSLDRAGIDELVRSHGLEPGGYFLYAGNLDPYQDLPLLARVARERTGSGQAPRTGRARLPIVVATHDDRADPRVQARRAADGRVLADSALHFCRVGSTLESSALLAGARASLVPRRTLGGFPIKLANSLAAGIPVVAFHAAEWGLADGRDALIADPERPVASLAHALDRLEVDPALAARLGAGARATHRAQHEPARVAAETLALIESLLGPR